MNLRAKLIGLTLVALAPGIAVEVLNQIELRQSREAEVAANALRSARSAAGEIDRIVDSMRVAITTLAETNAVRTLNAEGCERLVAAVKRSAPHLSTLGAATVDGRVFCSTLPARNVDIADRNYFRLALEKKAPVIGDYTVGRSNPVPVLPVAAPFHDAGGAVAGVVVATLSLDWLAKNFESRGFAKETDTLAITDRQGTILVRLPDQERWVGRKLGKAYDSLVHASAPGTTDIVGIDDVPRILGYIPVDQPPVGLYVGFGVTRETAFAAIRMATQRAALLLVLGALLAALLAFLFGRNFILRPIERLADAARHWSRGEFGVRANLPGNDEFAALGGTADRMAAELETMTATLHERVREETAARLRSEESLRHVEKMETLGQLAGGIAHDFNNLLQVILNSLDRLKRRTAQHPDSGALQRDADFGLQAADRAAELVQRMLAFARRQPLVPQAIDPNRLLAEIGGLLASGVGERIRIETVLGAGVWTISADRGQLENALMNLAINARDAMPDGGRLLLETANCFLDDAYVAQQPELAAGQYVMFSVSDSGVGMPPEIVARAFDPFFTTKPAGQGTGLGLSHVYGFAKQSKGHVKIYSEPSQGTTVKLYLPRAEASAADAGPLIVHGRASGSGEKILLVEDEAAVRDYSRQMLVEAGYSVLAAEDGPAALALLDRHPEVVLLFTDVGLPGMNGRQLADEARRRRPGLKVLFASGYARNAIVHDGRLDPGVELLTKPFTADELLRRLSKLLAEA